MQIELTPDQEQLVRLGIEQGRYENAVAAVQRAMNLWVESERKRLELLDSLDEAVDAIEAGEYTEYDEESLARLPAIVANRSRVRLDSAECASA